MNKAESIYRSEKAEGTHRMAIRSIDKDGNEQYQFYDFNDPEHDAMAIDNGSITNVEFLADEKINTLLEISGVFTNEARDSKWSYAYREGSSGVMDYGHMGFNSNILNKNTFYIRSKTAYNIGDIGKYILGRGMAELGFGLPTASLGAHVNNAVLGRRQGSGLYNFGVGTYGGWSFWDSPEDQKAIREGYASSPRGQQWLKKDQKRIQNMRRSKNPKFSFSIL